MAYDSPSLERFANEGVEVGDPRRPFRRDRDRILSSPYFRRLARVTQVTHTTEVHLFHTRLTHSLKVGVTGRTLADSIGLKFAHEGTGRVTVPDPDLVEAACLAHDLGHPPFGHTGERALNEAFDNASAAAQQMLEITPSRRRPALQEKYENILLLGGFEGNAQTFRILTYLSPGSEADAAAGLNLTRATLDATIKYPWLRQDAGARGKWGAIGLDLERFAWVRNDHPPAPDALPSFEAQLMDWADDLTYATHDLLDYYSVGLIPLRDIFETSGRSPGWRGMEVIDTFRERNPRIDANALLEAWARLAELGLGDLPLNPTRTRAGQLAMENMNTRLVSFFTEGASWTGDAPCRHLGRLVRDQNPDLDTLKALACYFLKQIVALYVHAARGLRTQQYGHSRIVRSLFEIYYEAPELLSEIRQEELAEHGDVRRAATDEIASATESEVKFFLERFTGATLGSFTDLV
jgi:dGTPase